MVELEVVEGQSDIQRLHLVAHDDQDTPVKVFRRDLESDMIEMNQLVAAEAGLDAESWTGLPEMAESHADSPVEQERTGLVGKKHFGLAVAEDHVSAHAVRDSAVVEIDRRYLELIREHLEPSLELVLRRGSR